MNRKNIYLAVLPALPWILTNCCQAQTTDNRPNIILILADDMGYSDIGCYGGEIQTPNLDKLASAGLRYRQFYNGARSCPTRASLLTGLYAHQAGMGWMTTADMQRPPYQGCLNNECVTIAEVLKSAGYSTYMSGKWHVSSERKNSGGVQEHWPNQRGFDEFYGIVGGAANYFNMKYNRNNQQFHSPKDGTFYFTHAISDSAAIFIKQHSFEEKPLFLYLAYTAPHWPLQALQKDIDKYVDVYKAGWDQLRETRFQRQKKMGLFSPDVQMSPRDEAVPAWDSLSKEEQKEFAMRMAIYAAQIDAMDQGVGLVVEELRKKGQLDNTIIMFLSDNGACAEFISSGKRKAVDGKEDTFESYRRNWANVSSTPYKEYKHHTNEGGIATPLIVHYPKGISQKLDNSFVNEYGHITDIMATCVDFGKASYPTTYKGHTIVPMQGVSLRPNFIGKSTKRGKTFWEHEANIAVREGKWKIVTKVIEGQSFDENAIHLYDMNADPTELNDLATTYPQKKNELYAAWKEWANKVEALPLDTRSYGERRRDYKRRCINGQFDDNFGDWKYGVTNTAEIYFSIDSAHTISGDKTARIDIKKSGDKPANGFLKWMFNAKAGEKVSIRFKVQAEKKTPIIFRLEREQNLATKLIDAPLSLTTDVRTFEFKDIPIKENGNYQLVFYVGKSDGVIWIDDVELDIK